MSLLGWSPWRFFGLALRLARFGFGEALFLTGNALPRRLGVPCWTAVLWFNPHHWCAAVNRAEALKKGARGWIAFQLTLASLRNPRDTSASDLYATWIPGKGVRRLAGRLLWGPTSGAELAAEQDHVLKQGLASLASFHCQSALKAEDPSRAREALEVWQALEPESVMAQWQEVSLAYLEGRVGNARELAEALLKRGAFHSPLDAISWARRFLRSGEFDLAGMALEYARRWTPEESELWYLLGVLECRRGNEEAGAGWLTRALSLKPDFIEAFLERWAASENLAEPLKPSDRLRLDIKGPDRMALGDEAAYTIQIGDAEKPEKWKVAVLPPSGWGLHPSSEWLEADEGAACTVLVKAVRPDRIRGGPWPLTVLALKGEEYAKAEICISVPDPRPGRILVAFTEDHEIQEERGKLPVDTLTKVLVEKSEMGQRLGVPWTHMVEVGSALLVPRWASMSGNPSWATLAERSKDHLRRAVSEGHDVQPHLHAFNLPGTTAFPYRLDDDALRTSETFLIARPEARGDWASACPPPGRPSSALGRVESASLAVKEIEEVGRAGDPSYRAVLWRSGLLDYGADEADRAWSTVALLRAGLLADSDWIVPDSRPAQPAFMADWPRPFEPQPDGVLLQLPICCNAEGNYLKGRRYLKQRIRQAAKRCKGPDDRINPGVHLFTMLTHDKFINARRGGKEFDLNLERGDWKTIKEAIEYWRKEGAEFVTAREGVRAVLDDLAWRPVAWLEGVPDLREANRAVSFDISWLGARIPSGVATRDFWVQLPPDLYRQAEEIRIQGDAGDASGTPDREAGGCWIRSSGSAIPALQRLIVKERSAID